MRPGRAASKAWGHISVESISRFVIKALGGYQQGTAEYELWVDFRAQRNVKQDLQRYWQVAAFFSGQLVLCSG